MIYFLNIMMLVLSLIYGAILFYLLIGLKNLPRNEKRRTQNTLRITVVIAARNEEDYIRDCVLSVAKQNYPRQNYEIVVANDRSTDRTGDILAELCTTISNLRVITIEQVPDGISPKKHALLMTVKIAKSDFILSTDADCVHQPDWLSSYAGLINENVGVVQGMTVFKTIGYRSKWEKTWQKMQAIEFDSLQLIPAGAIGHNIGLSGVGTNLLFARELYTKYEEETLRKNIVSGDDFFIVQMAQKYGYQLKFNLAPESIVETYPVRTIRAVIDQRARWGSKATKGSTDVLQVTIPIFIYYLGLSLYPLLIFINPVIVFYLILFWSCKTILDWIYLSTGYRLLKLNFPLGYFLLMEIVHTPYIIYCLIKGVLVGFNWKGKHYSVEI